MSCRCRCRFRHDEWMYVCGMEYQIRNTNLNPTLIKTPKTPCLQTPTDSTNPSPPPPQTPKTHPNPPHAPRILLANCTSFCIIVTRFAWMAHRFVSSNKWTRKASQLSCRAWMAWDCHRRDSPPVGTRERAISRTCFDCGWMRMRMS